VAITPPYISDSALPHASAYREFRGYRGGNVILVNGGISFDLVSAAAKRTFVIVWRGLTTAQKATINAAFDSFSTGAKPFRPPADAAVSNISVTWSDQQVELEWESTSVGGGTTLLWETTMMLREV